MKWHCAFNGLMGSTALLLPLMAVPESRLQTGAPSTASTASAHLDFKIVIPQVLYLHVAAGNERDFSTDTVGIMSNGRNVTLNATLATSLRAPDSNAFIRRNLILSAPARKAIAQEAQCTLASVPSARSGARSILCTASMP